MHNPQGSNVGKSFLDEPKGSSNLKNDSSKNAEHDLDNDYLKLRHLVLGDDYADAIKRLISKEDEVDRVSEALPEALTKCSKSELSPSLSPLVDEAIANSIETNPSRITNIIFPILGPIIRKAVSSALSEMVQNLNTLLERSLSFSSLRWRIKAWRAGIPYAQYALLQTIEFRVEQVLLVHKETGLLLNSTTAADVSSQDPELVSSMLTAISDFVTDSFSSGQEVLEKVRFGELELHLFDGPQAVLAIAVRGSASDEVPKHAYSVIEKIHLDFDSALKHFEGDRSKFVATDPLLSTCLLSRSVEEKQQSKPWLAMMLIVSLLTYMAYQSYIAWQRDNQFEQVENLLSKEANYVVIDSVRDGDSLYVKALRANDSRRVDEVEQSLSQNSDISVHVDADTVHFGPMPEPQVIEIPEAMKVPMVSIETSEERIEALQSRIQSTYLYFEPGQTSLSTQELVKIPSLIDEIIQLEALVNKSQKGQIQILLMGFADQSGSTIINNKVSLERANEVKALLIANEINSDIIVTWGAGHIDHSGVPENVQRRVTFQILIGSRSHDILKQGEPL